MFQQWCQLRTRMKNMHALFTRMQKFQYDYILQDTARPLADDVRVLNEEDLNRFHTGGIYLWQVYQSFFCIF